MLVPIPDSFCFTDYTQNKDCTKAIIILNQINANKVKLNTKRGMVRATPVSQDTRHHDAAAMKKKGGRYDDFLFSILLIPSIL